MKKEVFIALKNFEIPNHITQYGAQLAKKLDRHAFLFAVRKVPINTPPVVVGRGATTSNVSAQMKDIKQDAEQKLAALVLDTKNMYPNVYGDTDIGFNEPTIIEKTQKGSPYIVVVEGASELTTMHEWFGTYETRLAEKTEQPTLVVPEDCKWKPVNNILYIMDLDDEKVSNMRYLTEISNQLGARLTVVTLSNETINEDNERYLTVTNTLRELLGYTDVDFHRVFTENATETVKKIRKEINADWLAFEHVNHNFLERVFGDYNTEHLILQSERPVLVF